MRQIILLVPNNIKKQVIKEARKKYYNLQIKFMSLEEFIRKLTFDYDNKTIYYLMKKFNLKYDIAILYLNNLLYISDKLDNEKMNRLKEIKKYLDDNNLLIYSNHFRSYVLDKEIYIYGYNYINKYYLNILKNLNYKIINKIRNSYKIDSIFLADSISDEVIFVCNKICSLLKNNISIERIKLIYTKEYEMILDRFFKLYKIPISTVKKSIYSTYDCKMVLNNLEDVSDVIENIEDKNIYNIVIDVLNKFSFADNKEEVRELIIKELKHTYFGVSDNVIGLDDYIEDDDYVFLLGFNKENYPKILKDDDYFSDKEKEILGISTSNEINELERESVISNILGIKNLTITYKLFDSNNNYTKSDLFTDIHILKIENNDYSNSDMLNKVLLAEKLDNLVKFNIKDEQLDLLYSNYSDIDFLGYDNSYKKISSSKLYGFLNNKLSLSYTSMDSYNRCKFKYYIQYILNLNIIKNDFSIIVGELCHYLLANMDNDDFNMDLYYDKYLNSERELSAKELFFLSNIKEEMIFVINTIRKQLSYTTFDKHMYEKRVFINKDQNIKVTFTGIIDKVLYKEEDGFTYLVIVDYKTGNTNIKLDNIEYGIDLQLPIYLYLSSKLDLKNIKIVGFYLQKLLDSNLDNRKEYLVSRENNLKLEGYSINNEHILSKFDKTYNDSKLIKSMKTKKDGFYAYSKVLSEEEIERIVCKVDEIINKTIDSILGGDFEINPKVINNENISCKYCEYRDICYMKDNDIVYINHKKEEEMDE